MRIGLTKTENPEKHNYYVEWLKGSDNIEIVRLSADDNNADEIKNCDALVLSGGIDIHPKFYGGKLDYPAAPEKFNEKRDEFEIAAFHSAQENNLPVLGICRGMQLINIIHGGTLIQHLPNEELIKTHKGEPDKSHLVNIEASTLLYQVIGSDETEINSAHHQGIDQLGDDLLINARSADGLAEGFERKNTANKPFLLAVQWHPERMFRFNLENSRASKALRNRFIEEVKQSIAFQK